MVGRAFVEALKFGAPGGVVLALGLLGWLNAADGGTGPTPVRDWLLVTACVAGLGVFFGTVVAYPALVVAAIAADLAGRGSTARRRVVGGVAASLATFVALAGVNLIRGMSPGAWTFVPPLVVGGYAALVGWLRIPRILGR